MEEGEGEGEYENHHDSQNEYENDSENLEFDENQRQSQRHTNQFDNVVFDIGTHTWKVGFSSSEFPDAVVPSVLGFPKQTENESQNTELYLGTEAYKRWPMLLLRYPIEYSIVVDWDEFEELTNYILFNALELDNLPQTSFMFTEPAFIPKQNKARLAEIVFEKFEIGQMMTINHQYWSLVSEGKTTGIVVGNNSFIISFLIYLYRCWGKLGNGSTNLW